MRLHHHSAFGLIFGTGLALSGASASVACGNKGIDCEATKTCAPPATGATGGTKSAAGAPDADAHGASGGKGGSGGTTARGDEGGSGAEGTDTQVDVPRGAMGGRSGTGGTTAAHSEGGEAGEPEPPHVSSAGGTGGTSGSAGRSTGGQPSAAGAGGHAGATAGAAGTAGIAGHAATDPVPPGDTTAPQLTQISPPNGASGVTSDADIVLTFSEPMDTESVEQAYQSNDLPPAEAVFSWQSNSTVLTIHPKSPLVYADVTDSSAGARHYSYTLGTTAKDLAGNRLAVSMGTTLDVAFSTLRHVTQVIPVQSGGGVVVSESATGDITTEVRCDVAGSYVAAGDDEENGSLLSLVTFDLSSVPATGVQWQSATLTGSLGVTGANPYVDGRLGKLHVLTNMLASKVPTWRSSNSMTDLGLFATYASQTDGRLDVQSAVTGDYAARAARGNRSEYIFRFDEETDGNDAKSEARLNCSNLALTLEYLAP